MVQFNDLNIEKLFGVEDAENENPERLKEYFFRNKAFENLTVGIPIRVLVGHKGVGKSALLKVAQLEDEVNERLTVWLRPNDLEEIASGRSTLLNPMIEEWKNGIMRVIFDKIVERSGEALPDAEKHQIRGSIPSLLSVLNRFFQQKSPTIHRSISKQMIDRFRKTNEIIVYVDDLDRGWEAKDFDIRRISALLNAIRDLAGAASSIHFRLGLRSDVYYLVRTSDESTDKIERNIIWLVWDNHEILTLMAKRIETFFGNTVNERELIKKPQPHIAKYLEKVIVPRFTGVGKWENAPTHRVLLSLTRKRPRDLVKLFYGAAREAYRNDHNIIQTSDLKATFEAYSGERLQDIINEFRSELPSIESLIYGMKPTSKEKRTMDNYLYSNDQIITKIKNIMSQNRFVFASGRVVTPKSLAEFLYKIDFITARKDGDDQIIRRYFEQSRHLQSQFADFGFHWEIHPAYRWALQPSDVLEIFRRLDLENS